MKRTLLLMFVLLCRGLDVAAQSKGEKIIFPSPQAAQLGKFGGFKVNHTSGTPDVGIPIYTAKEGAIEIPISLAYRYTGYRPSELPGWCGNGWSLVAGGVVSRVVKGRRDEIDNLGYLAKAAAIKDIVDDGAPNMAKYQSLNIIENLNDNYPDIFSFQFLDYSGKFVFDETGAPRILSDKKFKITYVKGTETFYNDPHSIISWTIITDDGTQFTFGKYELSSTMETGNTWDTSSWHLTEIINIRGDKVTLEYTTIETTKKRLQLSRTDKMGFSADGVTSSTSSTVNLADNAALEIYLQKIKGTLWEVNFISSPYTKTTSGGLSSARRLDNIQVNSLLPTTSLVKQFSFTYDSNQQMLTAGEDGMPAYQMAYYGLLPNGIDGYTTSVDYWGYYNGQSNTTLIPGDYTNDLEPRTSLTMIGALQQITYPTKGYTTFTYEQNNYSYTQTNLINKSVIVVEDYLYTWRNGAPEGANPSFTLTGTGTTRVDVKVTVLPDNQFPMECNSFNGNSYTLNLSAGTYTGTAIFANTAFSPCNGRMTQAGFSVSITVKVFRATTANKANYGGIRVASMNDYTNAGATPITTTYAYNDAGYPERSSGVIAQEPVYKVDVNSVSGNSGISWIYSSTPFNPMAIGNHYYKEVRETSAQYTKDFYYSWHIDKDDMKGEFAFTVHKRTNTGALEVPTTTYMELGNFKSYDFMRTLLKRVTVKDLSGVLKHEMIYTYANTDKFLIPAIHHEFLTTYRRYITLNPGYEDVRLYYDKALYLVAGWPRKDSETVINYGNAGANPVTTVTTFEYNATHLQLTKQRVAQSDGSIIETATKYPSEYTSPTDTYIVGMTTANMFTYPIEEVTWLEKSAADRRVMDARLTVYGSFAGNSNKPTLLLPKKKYKFNGLDGSLGTSGFNPYNGNESALNGASYYEAVAFPAYDTGGNPLSIRFNQLENISYLWAYKGQHPVAEIKNADYGQLNTALSAAGTSFSALRDLTDSPNIKSKLDAVRASLTGALTSSYLYTPLVGVVTSIDPAGKTLVYEYDALERLKNIKNANGTIRESFCYNYAGQPIDCIGINISGYAPPATLALLGDPSAPPAPSSFLNFVGIKEDETTLLNWNTDQDTSSERFEVERSADGKDWTRIGSVEAQDGGAEREFYSFKDESPVIGGPHKGHNQYRLRIANRDGSYTFTKIEDLQFTRGSSVYPNPLKLGDQLHLVSHDKIAHVKIYDINGRLVLSAREPESTIDVNKLLPGTYLVQITATNGSVSVHSVVKQ